MVPRFTPRQRLRGRGAPCRETLFRTALGLFCATLTVCAGHAPAQTGQNVEVNSRPVSVSLINPATDNRTVTSRPVSVGIVNPATETRAVASRPVSVGIFVPYEATLTSRAVSVMVGTPRYGDLDFNGEVNVIDAIIDLQIAVEIIQPSGMQSLVGDVDLNQSIDVIDAIKILRVSVDLDPAFPDFPLNP